MRRYGWVLVLGWLLLLHASGRAVNLMQQVTTRDPAYASLRLLDKHGLLANSHHILFSDLSQKTLTRYDVAFALTEPMRLFVALADPRGSNDTLESQHRRDAAFRVLSVLTQDERTMVLDTAGQLLQSFSADLEELAPGLGKQAASALRTLKQSADLRNLTVSDKTNPVVRVSFDPRAEIDNFGNPLPLLPVRRLDPNSRLMTAGNTLYVRPASSLEAAVDVTINRIRFYGALATLPGQDASFIIRPELSGTAMVGVQFDIMKINDLGISGIVEYHIQRTNSAGTANDDTNIGGVTGIGIVW